MAEDHMGDDWFDPEATTFGDRLTGAREAAGLDQAELARRLGVKVKTIRGWEQDLSGPRANRLSILAGILNVSLIWLLTGEGAGPSEGDAAEDALLREVGVLRREAEALGERLASLETRLRAQRDGGA